MKVTMMMMSKKMMKVIMVMMSKKMMKVILEYSESLEEKECSWRQSQFMTNMLLDQRELRI